jgi:hypothetical protein
MQGFHSQSLDMRRAHRGATQLASVSGSRVAQAVHHRPAFQRATIECAATTSGVKLPATHLQASQAALAQVQATKAVNRKSPPAVEPQCRSIGPSPRVH